MHEKNPFQGSVFNRAQIAGLPQSFAGFRADDGQEIDVKTKVYSFENLVYLPALKNRKQKKKLLYNV
ncbi:MAG: hypothetical protein LBD28_05965 [Tannerellaceae bacterium]|jgi:hypothetical protein|nr:hypothetical protein [Tannerellaceae bacterium]